MYGGHTFKTKVSVRTTLPAAPINRDEQNDNIQHLRAIACLFVLGHHFTRLQSALPLILCEAWSGVDLFFAISGYVIAASFSRTITIQPIDTGFIGRIRANRNAIRSFFIKRFWRIFPPLIVTLSLLAFLTLTVGFTKWKDLIVEIAAALSMTYNYVVYGGGPFVLDILWSLALEGQFYMVIPFFLIACYTPRRGLVAALTMFCFIGAVVRPVHIHEYTSLSHDWLAVRYSTHCRLDTLAAGVFVFFLLSEPKVVQFTRDLSLLTVRALFFFWVLILLLIPSSTPIEFSHNEGFSILAIAAASIVFLAAGSNRDLVPFTGLRSALRYLGERSFGIYLVHRLTSGAFSAAFPSVISAERVFGAYGTMMRVVDGVFVISSTLIIADLMYRFVEKPGIEAGRYYSAKIFSGKKLDRIDSLASPLQMNRQPL
jgi:peptidoglycan/LPS O-acetylase OafA/YrhL